MSRRTTPRVGVVSPLESNGKAAAAKRPAAFFRLAAVAVGLCAAGATLRAEPLVPTRDDQVVEQLPATAASGRADARRLAALASGSAPKPGDVAVAVALARRDLQAARDAGDPRFAGQALAALRPWPDPATAPDDVLMLRATLQQYLHEFDPSIATLRTLTARPGGRRDPNAWLTLATVLRVQARYAESDAACREVQRAGSAPYAAACLAENAGLRGEVAAARARFEALIADPSTGSDTRAWLWTSLAELEERDARPARAEAAYQAALRLAPDTYARTAYADLLIARQRPAEALRLLAPETRTDAVLLRLAIAGAAARAPAAAADAAEMRERIALANERPDARRFHGREQAMFALALDRAPARALELARGNVALQREAIDLLVYAGAARAADNRAALDDARRLQASIGLHDRRVDALLR